MNLLFIYHIVSIIIVFLIMLNGYLRGSLKSRIDAILSIILILLVIFSFFQFGWKISIGNIIGLFIYSLITKRIAKIVAYKLLGRRTSIDTNRNNSINEFMSGDIGVEEYFNKSQKEIEKDETILMSFYNDPKVNGLLRFYNKSFDDYVNYYNILKLSSLGKEVAFDIVTSPNQLKIYLDMKHKGFSDIQIISKLKG